MRKAFLVALTEVRLFLRDKGDLAFSLLLPIAVFALMSGAFSEQSTFHGVAHIVNGDGGGKYSRLLIERLRTDARLDVEIHPAADAERKLAKSDLQMALFIPGGFSRDLEAGNKARLVFKQRGNGGQEGQIVAAMIKSAARQVGWEIETVQKVKAATQKDGGTGNVAVEKFFDRERKHPVVEVVETPLGGRPDPAKQFFPGIMTMFILFAISLSARTIVEERARGTLERLMTTGLTPGELFAGKFLSGIFRGFVQTFILLVLAYLVFRFLTPMAFLGTLLVALVFAAAASALGLLIAVLVRTEAAATWVAVFVTMAMTMLGGTFFAINRGSAWETASRFSLNAYANDAVKSLVLGGGMTAIASDLAVLASVAAAAFVAARLFFRVAPGGK